MTNEAKKAVNQLYNHNKPKKLIIALCISAVIFAVSVALLPLAVSSADGNFSGFMTVCIMLCCLSVYPALIMLIIFLGKKSSLKRSVKTLEKTGKLGLVSEITSGDYNSDGKIAFSKNLLYVPKRNHLVIAYDDIVWVYGKRNSVYGFTVSRLWVFCLIDGSYFEIDISDETVKEFLYRRPNILVGFTSENSKLHKEKVKEFKRHLK